MPRLEPCAESVAGLISSSTVYFLLLGITLSICLIASDVQAWYGYSFGDIISLVTSKYTSFYERGLRDDRAYVLLLPYFRDTARGLAPLRSHCPGM